MPLTNPWVSYVSRSYQQIKEAVLTKLAALVPEITDHTESNLWVKIVSIWAGLIEMLGYYVDNQAREAHIVTARLYASAVKHAKQHDYRIRARIPATAIVRVTFVSTSAGTSNEVIPAGTEFTTAEGLQFFSTEAVNVTFGAFATTSFDVPVVQAVPQAEVPIGTSTGAEYQEISIPEPKMADKSAVIRVNTTAWTFKETLGFSLGYMTHFVQSVDKNQLPVIIFGDDYQGKIPSGAAVITAEYKITEGAAGNVGANTITEVTLPFSTSGATVSCTNQFPAVGGTNTESLTQLRRRVPVANRTLMRAVTHQDYVDIASEAPGVAKAGVKYDCGKYVEIYVVPEGGGVATPLLLDDVALYMDDKKMITTSLLILAAGEVHIAFTISLNVHPQYNQLSVVADVKARIVAYMSADQQDIGGVVYLSNIYEVIESTPGVSWSNIEVMTSIPYARPLEGTTDPLVWTRATQPGSTTTVKWRIQMLGASSFQLFKDGSYVGTYSTGSLVITPEVEFTVSGTYTLGDQWEFVTYAYFGTIDLDEPSIPVSSLGDITINATGGV